MAAASRDRRPVVARADLWRPVAALAGAWSAGRGGALVSAAAETDGAGRGRAAPSPRSAGSSARSARARSARAVPGVHRRDHGVRGGRVPARSADWPSRAGGGARRGRPGGPAGHRSHVGADPRVGCSAPCTRWPPRCGSARWSRWHCCCAVAAPGPPLLPRYSDAGVAVRRGADRDRDVIDAAVRLGGVGAAGRHRLRTDRAGQGRGAGRARPGSAGGGVAPGCRRRARTASRPEESLRRAMVEVLAMAVAFGLAAALGHHRLTGAVWRGCARTASCPPSAMHAH